MNDLISRREVSVILDKYRVPDSVYHEINKLPEFSADREKGKWITDDTTGSSSNTDYYCSNCGRKLQMTYTMIKAYQENGQYLFCDHCGADMRGSTDE